MGKGQRSRLARADEVKAKKEALKKQAKKEKIVRIVSIVAVIVVALGLIAYFTNSALKSTGFYLRKDVAVESANYKVNNAMMIYFFNNTYSSFIEQNEQMLQYYGLDTSGEKSLTEQTSPFTDEAGTAMTWYDYFKQTTTEQVKLTLALAEEAKAKGITLSEANENLIENNIASLSETYKALNVQQKDLRTCLELSMLASQYQTQIQEGIKVTEDDMEAYYTEHKNDFDVVDFMMYSFSYATAEEGAEDTEAATPTYTKEEAEKLANELGASADAAAYEAWLRNYFTTELKITEQEKLDQNIKAYTVVEQKYDESYVGNDFLFDKETKAGTIKVVDDESSSCYKVFLLVTPARRDESTTKTVRHILISVEDGADETAKATAKKEAEDLLAKWKAGDASEESFAALVHDNTDDTGSKETGGLYENFGRGEMVEAFENWAYDDARKTGDTGIVETEYGYHIMYFVADGTVSWKGTAESKLQSERLQEQLTALVTKYNPIANTDKIEKLKSYIG